MGLLGGYTLIYIIKLPLLSIHLNGAVLALQCSTKGMHWIVHLFYYPESKAGIKDHIFHMANTI